MNKFIAPILLSLVLTACGGGPGGSSEPTSNSSHTLSNTLVLAVQSTNVDTVYNTAVGDLNGDGLEDVVVGGWKYDSAVAHLWVFTQNADGTLTDSTLSLLGSNTYLGSQHVFIADFDNDGKNDIWLPGFRDGSAEVPANSVMFWGTGSNAQFTRQTFTEQTESHGACIDDVNGDGKLDMIVADSGASGGIYYNQGNRTFVLDNTVLHGNNYFSSCAVMHQTNGDVDIFLSNNYATGIPDNINVYDSAMVFQSAVGITAQPGEGATIDSIAVDVTGDGVKDLITMHNSGNGRDIWVNTAGNTYLYYATLDTLGNDYYSYLVTVDNTPMILMPGNSVGTRLYRVSDHTVYQPTAFSDMAAGHTTAQAAAVYRNTSTNKSYMLQLLDTSFYIKEIQ